MVKLSLPLWLKMQKHCLKTMISLRDPTQNKFHLFTTKVLYMCFDKFLLAVESRDLSQADKSIIMVSSFPS